MSLRSLAEQLVAPAGVVLPEPDDPLADWPAELGDHLSATQLTMFMRCPEQWRRRYVLGEKERPGAALIWGSADHYAHEQNFRQKITSHEDIPEDDVKVAFAEGFDQAVARHGSWKDIDWGSDKPSDMKDAGTELVGLYHRTVSPRVVPTAVEDRFSLELPRLPVPIVGYVDVMTPTRAIERKTARRFERGIKPDWRLQGLIYQTTHECDLEWHVSVKTKVPAVYTAGEEPKLRLPHNERSILATTSLVESITRMMLAHWRAFGPNEPWPGALTHPWACDYCGYRANCFYWEV